MIGVIVLGAVVLVVLVGVAMSLFVHRHGEDPRPERDWTRTDEVFRDPATDRVMRVWTDKRGDRHYVGE